MKLTFHLPVVAALALVGVVLAEPEAGAENEHRANISGAAEDPKVDPEIIRQMADLIQEGYACLEGITELLRSVEDLASADAAVAKVAEYTAIYRKRQEKAEALRPFVPCTSQVSDAIGEELVKRGVDVEKSRLLISEGLGPVYDKLWSMEPPYFGSKKLVEAVEEFVVVAVLGFDLDYHDVDDGDDDDDVYTEEQLQQADAACEKLIAAYAGWAECLKGVHDKETADAAAELYKKWDELRYGIVEEAFAGGWITPLSESVLNDTRVGGLQKAIKQEIKRLKAVDPPFYGNETLQRTQRDDVCP